MQKPQITIVGHVCIDHNTIEGKEYRRWGSPAAYIAHYYRAHTGVTPEIFAVYGEDFISYASGLSLVVKPVDTETLRYENVFVKGEREWFCRNVDTSPLPNIDQIFVERLRQSDAIIFAPLLPVEALSYVAELSSHVPRRSLKAVLPQGFMRHVDELGKVWPQEFANALEILPHFDLAIISSDDHPRAFELVEEWTEHCPKLTVIVTEGENGATIIAQSGRIHVPTTPLRFEDIKNPVGGGDVFSAQVILGLCNGKDIKAAVKAAHKTTTKVLLHEPLL